MKQIIIQFIDHEKQRLGEVGDWYWDKDGDLRVFVTDLGHWRYNFLFARHEMDEAVLCRANEITTEDVDEYDQRNKGEGDSDSFSGYPGAIYQAQHNDALAAEWQMSRLLGVDWEAYAEAVGMFDTSSEREK